jgi:hypothetical protein
MGAAICSSAASRRGATTAPRSLDWLPDDTPLLALDSRMVCTRCGLIGADVRPDWTPMTGTRGMGGAHYH